MTIPTTSREALHAILDLALDTENETASIFFSTSPHCGVVNVDVHTSGWKQGVGPDFQLWISDKSEFDTSEKALAQLQAHLEPENLARIAAEKRKKRVETLRQQLADARKEIA